MNLVNSSSDKPSDDFLANHSYASSPLSIKAFIVSFEIPFLINVFEFNLAKSNYETPYSHRAPRVFLIMML